MVAQRDHHRSGHARDPPLGAVDASVVDHHMEAQNRLFGALRVVLPKPV
jgi:hypothetical protein